MDGGRSVVIGRLTRLAGIGFGFGGEEGTVGMLGLEGLGRGGTEGCLTELVAAAEEPAFTGSLTGSATVIRLPWAFLGLGATAICERAGC